MLVKYTGFDDAIVGITVSKETDEPNLVYCMNTFMAILEDDGMDSDDAYETVLEIIDSNDCGDPTFICAFTEEIDLKFDEHKKSNLTLVR
jgi:hypothetical protein